MLNRHRPNECKVARYHGILLSVECHMRYYIRQGSEGVTRLYSKLPFEQSTCKYKIIYLKLLHFKLKKVLLRNDAHFITCHYYYYLFKISQSCIVGMLVSIQKLNSCYRTILKSGLLSWWHCTLVNLNQQDTWRNSPEPCRTMTWLLRLV